MRGGGMIGGGLMQSMMQDMNSMGMGRMGGMGGMGMMGGMPDMESMMQTGRGGSGGPGQNFSSHSCCMSSSSSGGGPPKVQQFSQSSHGGMYNGEVVSETQQSYSDSHSGTQKAALERARGDRARKIVKERVNGRETSRDMLKNVREDQTDQFDNDWNTAASHSGISATRMRNMLGGGGGGGSLRNAPQQHKLQNTAYNDRDRDRGGDRDRGHGGTRRSSSNLPYGGTSRSGRNRNDSFSSQGSARPLDSPGSMRSGSGRTGRSNSRSSAGSGFY